MANRWGNNIKEWETLFSWAPKSLWMVTAAMKLEDACSLEEKLWEPRQHIKKQRHYFANKACLVKSMVFPVVMFECESWTIKKAEHWRMDAFELWCWRRLFRVPWTARRSNQSILKKSIQNFHWRTDVEVETPIFWPPDAKSWLIWKDPEVGKDWGQEKGTTEDEMVGWHHGHNEHEFEWTPGVGDRQGGLACCSSWGHKELDTTEWLNWTELGQFFFFFMWGLSVRQQIPRNNLPTGVRSSCRGWN